MMTTLLFTALLLLLVIQGFLLYQNKTLAPRRKAIRAGLNALVWLVVTAYVWQPTWPVARPTTHALLVADDVPTDVARQLQDSLGIRERVSARSFRPTYDSVTLLGQDVPVSTLTQLAGTTLRWFPYNQSGRAYALRWSGIVRDGEPQSVTGRIRSAGRQWLRIRYGGQTLDSLRLPAADTSFALQFPAFGRGRVQTELMLDDKTLDTLRFFVRPPKPLRVRFVLSSPDFESKTLADWLGKHGHRVSVVTKLARDVSQTLRINAETNGLADNEIDLLITDPANGAARAFLAKGASALFLNVAQPETDARRINQTTGSRFVVRRSSAELTVPISHNLTAQPYRFADAPNQFLVNRYPIAVQQTVTGRVGMSLLNETFPLALSGDSLTYGRIWTAVLARLHPTDQNNVAVEAPVLPGLSNAITLNNPIGRPTRLSVGTDTVSLTYSPLNPQTASATYRPDQPGWQPLADSLQTYVERNTPDNPVVQRERIRRFMLLHNREAVGSTTRQPSPTASIPKWLWLVTFLLVFTALWLEPKL